MDEKLGRGLSAIFGEDEQQNSRSTNSTNVDINLVTTNAKQPRKYFDEEKLRELSESIKQHGILQPIAVRQNGNTYELLAGERRLRAAKMAGLKEIPVYVIQSTGDNALTLALVENIQRDNLNAIEEAEAFKKLIEEHRCTQENLAFILSKSRSYIANSLRLLSLPDSVKDLVREEKLSSGHARLLIGNSEAEEIAKAAVEHKMTVRTLEQFIQSKKTYNKDNGTIMEKYEHPDEREMSERISGVLGMRSKLKISNHGGILTIYCRTFEQLESLTQTLLAIGEP
ncbi:MAG: ParB/RepB/Spo0J family partition protein [Holosporales bacterium]|jgi:ParB family chromosome partitioning protein|nr:ParB/RepB/Spo0J family partition protein [Holosporales bacterium]